MRRDIQFVTTQLQAFPVFCIARANSAVNVNCENG
jgi:hypothetical protein